MANEEQLAILKQGVDVWNKWRETDLIRVDLSEANLSDMDLGWVNFSVTDLRRSNLGGSLLTKADLTLAVLSEANLKDAILENADISTTVLNGADLSGADLSNAKFAFVDLSDVRLDGAILNSTIFSDVDLSRVKGLDTVKHDGPSTIGIDTIYRSGGNIPESFLRKAGVPENFIEYMHSLTRDAFDFYSCFISHSIKDQSFVERLYNDLLGKGVRCWYAPKHMKTGDPLRQTIFDQIRLHEKLLLVLSEQSLASTWVEDEVERALDEEQRHSKQMLFPIRLDNAVMDTSQAWAVKVRQRHITDFTGWKHHDIYCRSFDRLMRDLKIDNTSATKGR
ncbi:MAG: toll/interleukin-1 receptor domain-containing protein [Caldilineaceae bacterium]